MTGQGKIAAAAGLALRQQRRRSTAEGLSVISAMLNKVVRSAVIVEGATAMMSACAHTESSTTTTTAVVSSAATPTADSLIVSLDDVRRVAGVDDLMADPRGDEDQPKHLSSSPPGRCAVFDPQVAFGSEWSQYRSTVYNGLDQAASAGSPAPAAPGSVDAVIPAPPKPLMIIQTVAVYPDADEARAAFENIIPALIECSALHAKYYDFTVDQPDASTAVLKYPNEFEGIYRVASRVLIQVSAGGFSRTGRVADAILQEISDRVH